MTYRNPTPATGGPPAPRVLVVEDHPVAREPLLRILRLSGYDAVGAGNGAEALAEVDAAPVDLILLDLMMPKVDGVMFLEALRNRPGGTAVPVLVLTAVPNGSLLTRVKALGAAAVLRKAGFDLDELLAAIRAHLPATHGATTHDVTAA
ncbi:MAG: hypothetical protein AVDCRST_MAG64-501 [uncultured Phycisphaerae bacterium]|uniref:Response regulatory domain-containing protein n=1 Tax=uncultured Phycisphaerae bacterium TaxID=904963 RepID=A0A6J4N9P7_9BACT|nr:MAG: hypothetical protein AVDCRST_MAG64-501 [uncultured Phycisphaerae bacterium]